MVQRPREHAPDRQSSGVAPLVELDAMAEEMQQERSWAMLPVGWTAVPRTYGASSKSCGKTYVPYFSLDGKYKHITAGKLKEIEQIE